MGESIGIIIMSLVFGTIGSAILLRILYKHFRANLVFMVLSSIAVMVVSFAMPFNEEEWEWNWILAQGICLYILFIVNCAGFSFDKEDYIETHVTNIKENGDYDSESKLESRSLFWSVVGGSLAATIICIVINYMIFERKAIGLGVLGAIGLVWAIYVIITCEIKPRLSRRNYY